MIVATAATLFVHNIPLESGEQAALAIKPFAGELAGTLFAIGILNAGFMGIVVVSLSTAYAFSEFLGLSGSLSTSYTQSKTFYVIFSDPVPRDITVPAGDCYSGAQRDDIAVGVLLPDHANQ